MSKELTPLEAFNRLKGNPNIGLICDRYFREELDIVETALKRLEKLEGITCKEPKDADEILDFLLIRNKALEIIKELFKEMKLRFIFSSDNIVLIVDDSGFEHWHKCKTREEYELLMEVLL